jgi:tetratricopeptide (TPR) repeat protein
VSTGRSRSKRDNVARSRTSIGAAEASGAHESSGSVQLAAAPSTGTTVMPFNARRLEEAQEQWAAADWTRLSAMTGPEIEAHPERACLGLVAAAAALQMGDRRSARESARLAAAWGCDRRLAAAVLLASARNVLGRASLAAGRAERANEHFKRSLLEPRLVSHARRIAQRRTDQTQTELTQRVKAAQRQRASGAAQATHLPTWIDGLVEQCMSAADVHEVVDSTLAQLLGTAQERVQFLMGLATAFERRGDKLTAVHFLNHAREQAAGTTQALRQSLAGRLVALGQADVALDLLVEDTLVALPGAQFENLGRPIRQAYAGLREAEQARREHGHELLLSYLKLQLPAIRREAGTRSLSMVEIGTTRENVPGQGSTRKLAEFCHSSDVGFVTVDMDPHNAHVATELFARMGVRFEALAAKGEDYLARRLEPVDFVFLDAYDFDHGKHSELRQSRYQKFLGSRIDEEACHRMHLDCAQSLLRLLTRYGVVCIDDTWLENGHWTAKGTLAMPYLLENGFELIEARNRAALLRRAEAPGTPGTVP